MRASLAAGCLLLFTCAGCVDTGAPATLDAAGGVDAPPQQGLTRGRLSVRGTLAAGANDFELTLAAELPDESTRLDSFTALMPGHGHRATPGAIELAGDAYEIEALPLSMSGVWRLTGELQVNGRPDTIWFDVDVP